MNVLVWSREPIALPLIYFLGQGTSVRNAYSQRSRRRTPGGGRVGPGFITAQERGVRLGARKYNTGRLALLLGTFCSEFPVPSLLLGARHLNEGRVKENGAGAKENGAGAKENRPGANKGGYLLRGDIVFV